MLYYILITLTFVGVVAAIIRIVTTNKKGDRAEKEWEDFNRKYPLKDKYKDQDKES